MGIQKAIKENSCNALLLKVNQIGRSLVNITPLSSSAVHSQTVALHHSIGVPEGQAAALTTTVDQRRGRLLVGSIQLLTAVDGKGAEESEEDDVATMLHG